MRKPRPLADLLDACLAPALRAQGFAAGDVVMAWPDIVGERLAAFTQPLKLEWKRKGSGNSSDTQPSPATLVIRVESAFALEMQHLAPQVMERVNAHYGWRCVGKLVLKQGPVRRLPDRRKPERSLTEAERRQVDAALAPIAEDRLKGALDRLGRAVLTDSPGSSRLRQQLGAMGRSKASDR
jgi:hypothetical protein